MKKIFILFTIFIFSAARLIGTVSKSYSWPSPHNVTQKIAYPPPNFEAQITYVEIAVNQTSNIGQARIISGGLNQRHIGVEIRAGITNSFEYKASFYGFKF